MRILAICAGCLLAASTLQARQPDVGAAAAAAVQPADNAAVRAVVAR